ncbi:MAG: DUF1538 domain-containing protein [Zetaproteobacteria bacterium]|nr:DUF1538 domain-containing protein [Zetaproteobacteria bacterium]
MIDLLIETLISTLRDVIPVIAVLFGFQYLILKRPVANLKQILQGIVYVILGLALFLVGLQESIFPLGEMMAKQLTNPMFVYGTPSIDGVMIHWQDYGWVYVFGFTIGIATAMAEPALMAVALKAETISAGTISALGLRIAASIGVALGVAIGCFRIVTGAELWIYIMVIYIIIILQTFRAPKTIIPLAYDSGGVTTSTVTVPMLAALGLGLAESIPGRSPLMDGFGLIAFACAFPIMTVMGYAQLSQWINHRNNQGSNHGEKGSE